MSKVYSKNCSQSKFISNLDIKKWKMKKHEYIGYKTNSRFLCGYALLLAKLSTFLSNLM